MAIIPTSVRITTTDGRLLSWDEEHRAYVYADDPIPTKQSNMFDHIRLDFMGG